MPTYKSKDKPKDKRFTRRNFLKLVGAAGAAATLSYLSPIGSQRYTALSSYSEPTSNARSSFQDTDTGPYSYVIHKKGSTYYADSKDFTRYSNADFKIVFESATNTLGDEGGGRVIIKPLGSVSVNKTVWLLRSNIHVLCEALGTTKLIPTSNNFAVLSIGNDVDQLYRISVENLEVDFNGQDGASNGNCIKGQKVDGIRVHNCILGGSGSLGGQPSDPSCMSFSDCVNGVISNNYAYNFSNGIGVTRGSSHFTIVGNRITGINPYDSIYTFRSNGWNSIIGNICTNASAFAGILVDGSPVGRNNNTTVAGNVCAGNNFGIYIYSSYDCVVSGNTCNDNIAAGIRVRAIGDHGGLTITGNSCKGNMDGMITWESRWGSMSSNIVRGNTRYGIFLDKNSNHWAVQNNHIHLNGQGGIRFNTASQVLVTGNNLRSNTESASNTYSEIYLAGSSSHNYFVSNYVDGSGAKYAIEEAATRDGNNLYRWNRIHGAWGTAATLINGTNSDADTELNDITT